MGRDGHFTKAWCGFKECMIIVASTGQCSLLLQNGKAGRSVLVRSLWLILSLPWTWVRHRHTLGQNSSCVSENACWFNKLFAWPVFPKKMDLLFPKDDRPLHGHNRGKRIPSCVSLAPCYEKAKERNKSNPAIPCTLQAPVNSYKQQKRILFNLRERGRDKHKSKRNFMEGCYPKLFTYTPLFSHPKCNLHIFNDEIKSSLNLS